MAVKQQKSLKLNFIMNAILTMSQFIFPLITFPYVSRILLPDGTGIQMSSSHDITLTPQEQALIMRLKSFHVPEMAHILEEQLKDPNADLNTFMERMV